MKLLILLASASASGALSATLPNGRFADRGSPVTPDIPPVVAMPNRSVQNFTADALAAYTLNNVAFYGAVCDGKTDDTASIQKAINASAANGWFPIRLPGMCKITTLIVDRVTGSTTGELRFEPSPGIKGPAGFVSSVAAPMFDSNLLGTAPISVGIGFYGLQFYGTSASLATYVMSPKFGIVTFFSDYFRSIKLVNSSATLQSYRLIGGNYALGWIGTFITARDVYDISIDNAAFQSGGEGLRIIGHSYGVRLVSNLFEGSTGPFLSTAGASGLTITGNYSEGNTNPDYVLSTGDAAKGVQFSGNFMWIYGNNLAKTTMYDVVVGEGSTVSSMGNYTNGRMFDDRGGRVVDIGSLAGLSLNESANNINLSPLSIFSLTTTSGAVDRAETAGVTSASHCSLTPTNASGAAHVASTYVSAKATGSISVSHASVAGMTYDILCTAK